MIRVLYRLLMCYQFKVTHDQCVDKPNSLVPQNQRKTLRYQFSSIGRHLADPLDARAPVYGDWYV